MLIPEKLHAFSKPTLIVATDNVHAKLYRVVDRDIEHLETISTKTDKIPGERHSVERGSGDMASGEPEDDRQDWSREQLYEKLSPDLMGRLKKGEFEAIAFTVPHEHINELKESLHIDLLKRATVFVPKNLVGEDVLDVVAHVQEAM